MLLDSNGNEVVVGSEVMYYTDKYWKYKGIHFKVKQITPSHVIVGTSDDLVDVHVGIDLALSSIEVAQYPKNIAVDCC